MTTAVFQVRFGSHPTRVEARQVDSPRPSSARQPDGYAHPTARYLAMAWVIERGLADGTFADYAAAAAWLGVTPARANMLAHLVLLAPEIQAALLLGELAISEHLLRPVCRVAEWEGQRSALRDALELASTKAEDGPRPTTTGPRTPRRDGGTGRVATQPLQTLAVVPRHRRTGVQREALLHGAVVPW